MCNVWTKKEIFTVSYMWGVFFQTKYRMLNKMWLNFKTKLNQIHLIFPCYECNSPIETMWLTNVERLHDHRNRNQKVASFSRVLTQRWNDCNRRATHAPKIHSNKLKATKVTINQQGWLYETPPAQKFSVTMQFHKLTLLNGNNKLVWFILIYSLKKVWALRKVGCIFSRCYSWCGLFS